MIAKCGRRNLIKDTELKENRKDERRFAGDWFTELLSTGNFLTPNWLIYLKGNKHYLTSYEICSEGNAVPNSQNRHRTWKSLHPGIPDNNTSVQF
jgi:hypothetical protein